MALMMATYIRLNQVRIREKHIVIHKYLTNQEKDTDWLLYEERLKETLKGLNLETKKTITTPNNASEIIPLIDSIKDLVTEIPESDDDK